MGKSKMTLFPIDCRCNQASKSCVSLSCNSAMVQDTYILCPLWTGMDILAGLSFHRSLVATIMSTASRAATFLKRALSQVFWGRSTMSLRSLDFDGTELPQKCSIKMLHTLPYSVRTLLSSCRLWTVANLREHLVDRMNFIKINRDGAGRLLQKRYSSGDTISDSRLYLSFLGFLKINVVMGFQAHTWVYCIR